MERPFLNNLIEMKLQLQAAGKMGLSVSDDEVDAAIADIKKKFNLTDEAFLASLRSEMLSMKEYRNRLREQILLQKVINFAVRASVVVPDEEIESYLKEHEKEYGGKEKLRIRQIFFSAPGDGQARKKLLEKADQIYRRIVAGEDFSALAKLYSEGPAREFGGDIGYISRGSALKELEDTALALKVGEVSRPFWSRAGLHIIKLEERLQGGDAARVKENIKKMLSRKKFEEQYHNWISQLRENANIEIKL
jgi:peptidyl-prolyl cis-trans isomerase SurA